MESPKPPVDAAFASELEELREGKVSQMSGFLCPTAEDLEEEVKKSVDDMPDDLTQPVRGFRITAIQSGVHEAIGLALSTLKKGNSLDKERVLSWANSLGRDLFEKTIGDPDLLEEGPVAEGAETEKRVLLVSLKDTFKALIEGVVEKYNAEQARKEEEVRKAEEGRNTEKARKAAEQKAREEEQRSNELDPKTNGGRDRKPKPKRGK